MGKESTSTVGTDKEGGAEGMAEGMVVSKLELKEELILLLDADESNGGLVVPAVVVKLVLILELRLGLKLGPNLLS